jgi:hypothetical protein
MLMTKKSGFHLQQGQGGVSYKMDQSSSVDEPSSFWMSIDICLFGVKQPERESDSLLQVLPQISSVVVLN